MTALWLIAAVGGWLVACPLGLLALLDRAGEWRSRRRRCCLSATDTSCRQCWDAHVEQALTVVQR